MALFVIAAAVQSVVFVNVADIGQLAFVVIIVVVFEIALILAVDLLILVGDCVPEQQPGV